MKRISAKSQQHEQQIKAQADSGRRIHAIRDDSSWVRFGNSGRAEYNDAVKKWCL
ncbi:hypothetical protein E4U31_000123 [Claviceps sp. LM219 group G6]|nr:hypothetical protein E4U31_000123 [Claviceps sp. LM219 group G6]